jgi:hypothetical protein
MLGMNSMLIPDLRRRVAASLVIVALLLLLPGQQPGANSQQPPAQQPAVPDYVAFTRRIPNGLVNVGALELPDAFVERVADRSLRSHFRMLYRQVEVIQPADGNAAPAAHVGVNGSSVGDVRVVEHEIPADVLQPWMTTTSAVPELRGFRAPFPEAGETAWEMSAPARDVDPKTRAAALFVAEGLAPHGLVRTTLDAMRTQGVCARGNAIDMSALAGIGISVDLLAMHTASGKPFLDALQQWWSEGGTEAGANALADLARFEFRPTHPGFKVMAEEGSAAADMIRMQLASAEYATAPGDGSPMDVVRQLACLKNGCRVTATVNNKWVSDLLDHANRWELADRSRFTIVSTPAFASQWAQDNAKAGAAVDEAGAESVVTLLPRFANVNEQMTKCAPADSLIFESLRSEIGVLAMSPLLFQGGNVMCVTLPATGERLLLVGEAEVHRNRGLGLSERDVLRAFSEEFGVDRCEVLPAVSFHLDVEFTVRRVGDELIAVVGDDVTAARLAMAEAMRAFSRAGLVDGERVQPALEELTAGGQKQALRLTALIASAHVSSEGKLGGAFVRALGTSPVDMPDASAARLLHAMDLLSAVEARQTGQPISPNHSHERAYRESLLRRIDARTALAKTLADLGMRVVIVPNLGDEELGVNVINAVHLPEATLVPVSGGLFTAIDDKAIETYKQAFGDSIQIIPITTTYVQSKYGGVHCMVSVYPAVSD